MTLQPSELVSDLANELNQLHHQLAETQARLAALQTSHPASTTRRVKSGSKLGRRKMLRGISGGLLAAGLGALALPALTTSAATGTVVSPATHSQIGNQAPSNIAAGASFVHTIMGRPFILLSPAPPTQLLLVGCLVGVGAE